MKILCVDDHPLQVQNLATQAHFAFPNAEVYAFRKVKDAQSYGTRYGCDVLMCEIKMADGDGIMLAEALQKTNPKLNIIFITVCDERERAKEVMRLHPSGYLTKPFTDKQLYDELQHLRYPVVLAEERQSG